MGSLAARLLRQNWGGKRTQCDLSFCMAALSIEPLDESAGLCDCCGNTSRSIWGLVQQGDRTVAAYWLHWTLEHLNETGANLDLVIGSWGDGTYADNRVAIALLHREQTGGHPARMVIDAMNRPIAGRGLAGRALGRSEVIGTPLAPQVFALVDAIYEQDARFF